MGVLIAGSSMRIMAMSQSRMDMNKPIVFPGTAKEPFQYEKIVSWAKITLYEKNLNS
ncbi:MAG: hypothetical protein CM1200mP10_22780 [Candidatus Neomarinimicrobiota bacterium]|nr:MAG: hypothetical protein CM1200mP10_22780 [Candidatus Neomarinimicrobiota bacterium]